VREAALFLGWTELRADVLPDDWSEKKALAYLVADNELARQADPDQAQLAAILQELERTQPQLREAAGFTNQELEQLLRQVGQMAEVVDVEPQMDRAEELRQKWDVQAGDLWALDSHRLICGDCTDADVVARVLQGETPALMVTDPPYGVEYDPNWRNEAAANGHLAYAASRVGKVENDDRVDWSDAYRLFPGDVAYTWSSPGDYVILTGSVLQSCGYKIRNQIIWRKPHFPISRGHYTYQHEPCWYAVKKGRTAHWIGDANASTVWEIALDRNVEGGHSTQKPLECMARPIRNHEGDVYEPFCGSGTTIIACENLKRRCYAVEIHPGYVAVALERWHTLTGRMPELLEGGSERREKTLAAEGNN
jgi:DNA modification methylase